MNIRNTYWIASLGLILSFTLALPFCGHADIAELFSHQTETVSHAMHGQHPNGQQCNCGHEFVKDYQKTKKIANSHTLSFFPVVVSQNRLLVSTSGDFVSMPKIQSGIQSDSGPPIHLLNSVFLN